jgi:uncharacterized protein (DUF2141 family)
MILSACAREGFPPGGPEDRTPPQIVGVSPEQNATRVPLSTRLELTFSEKIDRASFEQAFFISPTTGEKKLRFRWHGPRVEVVFPDSLRPQRTYVVTLGTDVRDLRNNRMERAFSLAFSTGDSIDTGEIRGRIFHDKPAGILILAYLLELNRNPNPARDFADYLTQVGAKGDFVLSYLSDGRYRVFALEDRNSDRLYNRGEESIGVPSQDVVLDSTHRQHSDLNFRVAPEDTLRPGLAAITAPDRAHLILRFDEQVVPVDSIWERHVHVFSSAGDSLRILAIAPHPLDPLQVHAITDPQQAVTYKAFLGEFLDAAGNPLDSLYRQTEFAGNTQPDTSRPRLLKITPADSSRGVHVAAPVEMIFSEMMTNALASLNNKLQREIGGSRWPLTAQQASGRAVAGKGVWLNPFQFRFQPDTLWRSQAQYVVKTLADSTFDWSGNAVFDTTRQITFWIMNADTLSAISGRLTDSKPEATGSIHLAARQLGTASGSRLGSPSRSGEGYRVILLEPGRYRFEQILPGSYQLSAFRDANRNGRYDLGSTLPYVPAERYMTWPDTIKVRSRWPNEGNDFVLP